MQKFNNIVLFGGETNNQNLPYGFYSSLALLMVRGKPLIWWQLNNLKNNRLNSFILVINKKNKKLVQYAKEYLQDSFNVKIVKIDSSKSILDSLRAALLKSDKKLPTRVILGDTFITQSINDNTDTIYTSKHFIASKNWCLVDKDQDGLINNFYDKEENIDASNKEALIGYYTFSDTKHLLSCCRLTRLMMKREISDVLKIYNKKHKLKPSLISDWYDLGHTSGLIKAKNLLFSARSFNSIDVNTNLGLLIKTSTKIQKLEDEAHWYNELPEKLKVLTPRFVSFEKKEYYASLTQELYGYSTLQELYLSGEVNIEDWCYIIEKLFSLQKLFLGYKIPANKDSTKWLYLTKTKERLDELQNQNKEWEELLYCDDITVNGKKLKGINRLLDFIEEKSKKLCDNIEDFTIMHGDYCFSNILFDPANYCFRLIDPRGRLDKDATIYGDPRYDIAKLRHSVVGLYDFIVQKLYKLDKISDNNFNYEILYNKNYVGLEKVFDNCAEKFGYDVDEIKFIEGLLFLSMIPLHRDDTERQKMFYLKTLEIFNALKYKGSNNG